MTIASANGTMPGRRRTLANTDGEAQSTLVGTEACMQQLRSKIDRIGNRDCTVLICGESGTGKELVARHIHAKSRRASGPFVTVDCTTLRDTLFESQLFGHCRGAFTDAKEATLGLVRSADGGSLFLDEIGELQPNVQAKLLRCIQEGIVVPLGTVEPIHMDVRIIAATHRDLKEMVEKGMFREDLYYRLDVVRIEVPPLRVRQGDIVPLAEHFLARQARIYDEPVKTLSPRAKAALRSYAWPGNVRELGNAIEHTLALGENSHLTPEDFPASIHRVAVQQKSNGANRCSEVISLEAGERCLINRALQAANGNRTRASEMLGVERHRLGRMIRRHGLDTAGRSGVPQLARVSDDCPCGRACPLRALSAE